MGAASEAALGRVRPEPPRTPKAVATRARLLEIAARLFIERGYTAVSLRDLAAEAGMTKGGFYGHYRSKGQLLIDVLRMKFAAYEDEVLGADRHGGLGRVGLMYDQRGRERRLLEVDAAAAARHDPDVAAGLAELYAERYVINRERLAGVHDPDTASWLLMVLVAGLGAREAAGLPTPSPALGEAMLRALQGPA